MDNWRQEQQQKEDEKKTRTTKKEDKSNNNKRTQGKTRSKGGREQEEARKEREGAREQGSKGVREQGSKGRMSLLSALPASACTCKHVHTTEDTTYHTPVQYLSTILQYDGRTRHTAVHTVVHTVVQPVGSLVLSLVQSLVLSLVLSFVLSLVQRRSLHGPCALYVLARTSQGQMQRPTDQMQKGQRLKCKKANGSNAKWPTAHSRNPCKDPACAILKYLTTLQ